MRIRKNTSRKDYIEQIVEIEAGDQSIEHCGIICRGRVIEFENTDDIDRSMFFTITDEAIAPYLDEDFVIWHTHTAKGAYHITPTDVMTAKMWGKPVLMLKIDTMDCDYYDPDDIADLEGREWHPVYANCYTVIQDYYEKELRIELPDAFLDFPYEYESSAPSKFLQFLPDAGFKSLDASEPLGVGDIILTNEAGMGTAWHASLVVKTSPTIFCISQWVEKPSRYFCFRAIEDRVHSVWRYAGC